MKKINPGNEEISSNSFSEKQFKNPEIFLNFSFFKATSLTIFRNLFDGHFKDVVPFPFGNSILTN